MRIVCQQTILMKYHALFVIFEKRGKFWNCHLLQIFGGALRVNALLQLLLKLEHCKRFKAKRHPTKYDEINALKYFWQYFLLWQYIAGYTVASFWSYPIRCRVTKSSVLEFQNCFFFGLIIAFESYDSKHFTSFVMDIFINKSVDHGRIQRGGGGTGGLDPPPPWKITKI